VGFGIVKSEELVGLVALGALVVFGAYLMRNRGRTSTYLNYGAPTPQPQGGGLANIASTAAATIKAVTNAIQNGSNTGIGGTLASPADVYTNDPAFLLTPEADNG
jgi:hypothetical protein